MNTNANPGYPKGEMMDNITDMNTNPSSGYPKEEVMDNITNKNTSSSSRHPQIEMVDNIDSFSRNWPFMLYVISSFGYQEEGFVFILAILSITSSLGYP
jgi:hypothetical protein